ncbi:MAG: hypothetical protein ACRDHL_06470 [Candidatus Promineifilaceae bacterium]
MEDGASPLTSPLTPAEADLLQRLAGSNAWLRAVLCTLARRGVAYRQAYPERAQQLLFNLALLPYYKGGQFLFDLLEWEDFMLEGPPPPLVPTALDAQSLQRLSGLLDAIRRHLDGQSAGAAPAAPLDGFSFSADGAGLPAGEELPPLEPGLFLYQDVVLGLVYSILAAPQAADEALK